MPRLDRIQAMPFALAGLLLTSMAAGGQERTVVANQVEVSSSDASLHLEFSDGNDLTVSFEDGAARVDGDVIGTYAIGGEADRAWRALLSNVLALNNGALARALERWQPDPDLDPGELLLLRALDEALDDAVAMSAAEGRRTQRRTEAKEGLAELLQLLARTDYAEALGDALEETDLDDVEIWFNEDHTVRRTETVEGSLLLVDGELDVRGRVRGDVIVMDGVLTMIDGSAVDGNVHLIDSKLDDAGGDVRGEIVDVSRELRRARSRIRDEIRTELRHELRDSRRDRRNRSSGFVGRTARAVGGVFESLVTFILLGVLALVITRFGGDRVDSVARAIRQNPARSAAVGFAGAFLIVPVYILGLLVLTVSIVGIPALLIWAPLFPLAVALGAFVGYVSVSHHVGRWVLGHDFGWLNWADADNENHVRLVGLGTLLLPFAAASLIRVLPLVGWIGGLVGALGTLACLTALVMGFGAVIVTRGGRLDDFGFQVDTDAEWSQEEDLEEGSLDSEDVWPDDEDDSQ